MKESFNEMYRRLYMENYEELETLRSKDRKMGKIVLIAIGAFIISMFILPFLAPFIMIGMFLYILITAAVQTKKGVDGSGASYTQVFKEKVVKPIIETSFESATYQPNKGMSREDYVRAGYRDEIDEYESEDLITMLLPVNGKTTDSVLYFSEVETVRITTDGDGDRTRHTEFHGLAANFTIPKNIEKRIYIRANGKVSNWDKSKVKMDMSEFEKLFDVQSEDAILTMQVLTSDVMAEMVDLYKKYKYRFEVSIIKDRVHMRLRTYSIFEPLIFGKPLESKEFEKYQMMLDALLSLASHIYETIERLEV